VAAARYAARLLPGVFPPDDPVEAISLAPEHARALRQHLLSLDAEVFAAEDTLGWAYQFWRSQEKAAINASGRKIGAAELPAVTQLFTEPYMVKFLLHNTLGAWWAGKVLELPKPPLPSCATICSVWRSTAAACRSRPFPWHWRRGASAAGGLCRCRTSLGRGRRHRCPRRSL
jgi:hypothetical protein